MKSPTFHSIGRIIVFITLLLASCDTFEGDVPSLPEINESARNYYILPNTSAIINLKSLVSSSFTALNLRVAEIPTRGRLFSLDEFLVSYEPYPSFQEGSDHLKIALYKEGKLLTTVNVSIHMKADTVDFPCSVYAVEDKAITRPDASASIPFLLNDRICGFDPSKMNFSVYIPPRHGQATLSDREIIYVPAPGFEGSDTVIYKITAGNDTSEGKSVESYGIIIVTNVICKVALSDSYVLDLTDPKNDVINAADCAGAYEIHNFWNYHSTCSYESSFSVVVLSDTRHSGTACIGKDGSISYQANHNAIPKNDTIRLEVCHNGECKRSSVYVLREPKTIGHWTIVNSDIPNARSICFKTRLIGFLGGDNFMLKKTTNGGATWQTVPIGNLPGLLGPGSIYDLQFLNDSFGYGKVVLDGNTSGWISTKDGGSSWVFNPFSEAMTSIRFVTPETGFIGAKNYGTNESHLFKTTDGGDTWELKLILTNAVADIEFINEKEGFISASNEDFESAIYKTTDTGENWFVIGAIPFELLTLHDESIFAVRLPLFGASSSSILRSLDGIHWNEVIYGHFLYQLSFSPAGTTGIAVGRYAEGGPVVVISHDGGASWAPEPLSLGSYFADVISIPEENVAYVLCGLDGNRKLLKYEY